MRELHIKIPSFKTLNIIAVTIIISLFVYGVYIVRGVNQEFKTREIAGKFQQYRYATLSFNNIYSGLPGDISNATFYWKDVTRDGNADRKIESEEGVAAWQQLQLSKIVQFSYTLTGKWDEKFGENVLIPGINIPQIKGKTIGFYFKIFQRHERDIFGLARADKKTRKLNRPAITPVEAYNLDLMIDDGYPDKGSLTSTSDKSSGCSLAGEYKKESEIRECILLLKL